LNAYASNISKTRKRLTLFNKTLSIYQSINKFIAGNKAHKHTDTQTNRKTDTRIQKYRNKKTMVTDDTMDVYVDREATKQFWSWSSNVSSRRCSATTSSWSATTSAAVVAPSRLSKVNDCYVLSLGRHTADTLITRTLSILHQEMLKTHVFFFASSHCGVSK